MKSEKIEVYDIDVTRTSPESNSAGGEFTRTTGLGAILCRHSDKSRFYNPKVRMTHPGYREDKQKTSMINHAVAHGSGTQR